MTLGGPLGIGAWNFNGNNGGPWNLRTGTDTDNPRFVGPFADQAYHNLGADTTTVPVARNGGPHIANQHWREKTLGTELMTGTLNNGPNPISTVTIASLGDQFYAVDTTAAKTYSLPRNISNDRPTARQWPLDEHRLATPTILGVDEHGRVQSTLPRPTNPR